MCVGGGGGGGACVSESVCVCVVEGGRLSVQRSLLLETENENQTKDKTTSTLDRTSNLPFECERVHACSGCRPASPTLRRSLTSPTALGRRLL